MATDTVTQDATAPRHAAPARRLLVPGLMLGFALGGFFDGIVLHQILQWHHLLSLVEGAAFRDLRVQILADGVFHAFMYILAVLGLWWLWRARAAWAAPAAGRWLWGGALMGFGAWHVVDAVVVHWTLVLHRIRLDVSNPLAWDVGWMAVFGLAPLALGYAVIRRGGGLDRPGRKLAPAVLALATLLAGPVAALPAADGAPVMVMFAPGTGPTAAVAAAAAMDARLVWADASGDVWLLDLPRPGEAWRLYGHGAWLVGGSGLPAGCLGWSRPS